MPEERREQVTRVGIEQGQRVTGGTRRFRWKAAAFHGWHEPDKSRGLRPESVSGSGCKSPGRLGLGVKFPGPTRQTVEVVLSEYGPDLSRFPTEKEFVAHVTLAPRVPSSGGRPLKKKKRNSASTRVAAALRMAALSLRHSQTALGAYYRKLAQRLGGDVAVFATARKLATLIYRLLRWGQPYMDEGVEAYEKRYRQQRVKSLTAKAKDLGYELTAVNA